MSAAAGRSRKGRHARPRGRRLGRQIRLPSAGRLVALLAVMTAVGLTILAVNGPWLRVARVAYTGNDFTSAAEVESLLSSVRGAPLLALDTRSLSAELEELPAVASAEVEPMLPDAVSVKLTEKQPALLWQAGSRRLLVAGDGRVVAEVTGALPPSAASLPVVDDTRTSSQALVRGDSLPAEELDLARRLLQLDPKVLGSHARQLSVSVDPLYGLVLESDVG